MTLRVYLDTSIFSAYFDLRTPDRMQETQAFWERRGEFALSPSELAGREIDQTLNEDLRLRLQSLVEDVEIIAVSAEMIDLADEYVERGAFAEAMMNDAVHVAAAVMSRQDVLLSWNFKHLVNRRRRAQIEAINAALGLPGIDIIAPPEL